MGLTIAQLTQAIRRKVDEGMETVVAEGIAEHALGFFGFSNRIIDNALEPKKSNFKFIDLGGGMGISYSKKEKNKSPI